MTVKEFLQIANSHNNVTDLWVQDLPDPNDDDADHYSSRIFSGMDWELTDEEAYDNFAQLPFRALRGFVAEDLWRSDHINIEIERPAGMTFEGCVKTNRLWDTSSKRVAKVK